MTSGSGSGLGVSSNSGSLAESGRVSLPESSVINSRSSSLSLPFAPQRYQGRFRRRLLHEDHPYTSIAQHPIFGTAFAASSVHARNMSASSSDSPSPACARLHFRAFAPGDDIALCAPQKMQELLSDTGSHSGKSSWATLYLVVERYEY